MASSEAAAAPAPSPLDKPLKDLTEDDISQLTREDCRRFLKQKGMRRPSWNKSQAIQQVISLKTLLEGHPPDETPPQPDSPSAPALAAAVDDPPAPGATSEPAEDTEVPSDAPGEPTADGEKASPRESVMDDRTPKGQMTIFYCGKVNVYEGISPDKATAIMLLASSPNYLLSDTTTEALPAGQTPTCPQTTPYVRMCSTSPSLASVSHQTGKGSQCSREIADDLKTSCEVDYDGPTSRKVSLQRYLDKRKDRGRFKGKNKLGGSSSSTMEMYLSQHVRDQIPGEQSCRIVACSPEQPKVSDTSRQGASVENQARGICLSVDLNDDGSSFPLYE